ncbi:MAG: FkbM family methyltransferase [Bacteroidota bacterium]
MTFNIKKLAKKIQAYLPFAVGKNEVYDRYSKEIILKYCKPDSICIDIGANEGKILDWMIVASPTATHFAFEPIPALFDGLKIKFAKNAIIYPIALSDQKTAASFNWVISNPALSGLLKRPYPTYHKERKITVSTDLLDNIIEQGLKISLIKIDVEGGEWQVLKGAINTILNNQPIILFESGKLGGDLYGFKSSDIYDLFDQQLHYQIFTLKDWLKNKKAISYPAFENYFETGKEFFFLAAPIDIAI